MITNKDIRVENGNLVLNGDKFPLDGQSPEAIMQIVEDNSDTTPTENSDAPITSGGVFAADKDISDTIGDITQTGITGATVADQLAYVAGTLDVTRTNITPETGANTDNNNKCYYEKAAGVVNVVINVKQLTAGTISRICTLPEGYRPYSRITSAADDAGSGSGRSFVVVDTSGNVDAYSSATQYVAGQLTFVAYS